MELLATLGSAYVTLKRVPEAIKALEKAAILAPDRADIRSQLAVARMAGGQDDAALDDLTAAHSLDPERSGAG